jgi:Uma2 family endonuclease
MPRQATAALPTKANVPLGFDGKTPAWELAFLFPAQGEWTESDYFALDGAYEGGRRTELSHGCLEVLPAPTEIHQFIMFFLAQLLHAFAKAHAPGAVLPAGIRVRVKKVGIREPDVAYTKAEHANRRHNKAWDGADLVMEVVSPDPGDKERDWETKRKEYARGGIPEYWIIDPNEQIIRVLTLKGKSYRVHGDFGPGTEASSVLLPGFAVSVDQALAPPGSKAAD